MKATLTFDLSNKDEKLEYENIMASKDFIKAITELYNKTHKVLEYPNSSDSNLQYANTINNALHCALSDYNLDIRQFQK
jgi:hypothetical protein